MKIRSVLCLALNNLLIREHSNTTMATKDDFQKIDLRVGKILGAALVSGSTKLLSISVDIGEGVPREIVSGVAKVYSTEDLIGKSVIVVANLDTKVIAGVESHGMLIGIESDSNGLPVLIFTQDQIAPGSKIS
jgi:methionyl-tRNA synthetase